MRAAARHIGNEIERQRAYAAADDSNGKSKVSKIYLVNDDVWVTVELFIASPDDFKEVFQRSLSAILNGANSFLAKMNERESRTGRRVRASRIEAPRVSPGRSIVQGGQRHRYAPSSFSRSSSPWSSSLSSSR
ncbi:MAG: hypothetical protein FJY74_04640 [Candidatus Eisenbacteria bacterium]|nr:hypothetical protein [Candidatus Eisenbacteria bacterium]